jgi:hypothetical protein
LPDCLCLPNKLGTFSLFNFPLFARLMLNICPTFQLCNLLGGAAAPPATPRPVHLCTLPPRRKFLPSGGGELEKFLIIVC